ncbi:MAG: peptidoglycan-binding protein [Methylobacter sp.]|nr:MAG: peptidoglycan-binding protein [Methylobacter sp.]
MAFRILSGILLSAFISINACADELQINPAHPDQYTVVHGDTLWDISGKFLQHPTQWPELWRFNSQIHNPHLIYPGDTIYFSMVNGRPQLSLSRNELPSGELNIQSPCVLHEEDLKNGRTKFPVSPDGKLMPCIRESNLNQAIKLIPTDRISQFLTTPRVVGPNELNAAPYVVDLAGEHLVAGEGDKIYVRAIYSSSNQNYTVYRQGQTYKNPETGETLGYEAQYIADTTLQQVGDPASLAVTKSKSEIRLGDRVMPNLEEDITLNYFPRPPAKKLIGNIISVPGGVSQIGLYNTVVIDKGSRDGLQVGHELTIYRKGRMISDRFSPIKNAMVKLPDEKAGILMVFRPFERVSYALVMKANLAIHVLDKVKTP